MINLTWDEYQKMVVALHEKIQAHFKPFPELDAISLIGIPRGGLLVALHLSYLSSKYELIDAEPRESHLFNPKHRAFVLVDDVLETGKTRTHYFGALKYHLQMNPLFAVLVDKSPCYYGLQPADLASKIMVEKIWVVMPYEKVADEKEGSIKCYGEENDSTSCEQVPRMQ